MKYKLIITPYSYSKLFKLDIDDYFNNKEFDGVQFSVLPFKGFNVSGKSITIEVTTNKHISELKKLQCLSDFFKENVVLDDSYSYETKENTLINLIW